VSGMSGCLSACSSRTTLHRPVNCALSEALAHIWSYWCEPLVTRVFRGDAARADCCWTGPPSTFTLLVRWMFVNTVGGRRLEYPLARNMSNSAKEFTSLLKMSNSAKEFTSLLK